MAGYSGGQKSKLVGRFLLLAVLLAAGAGILIRTVNKSGEEQAQEESLQIYVMDDEGTLAEADETGSVGNPGFGTGTALPGDTASWDGASQDGASQDGASRDETSWDEASQEEAEEITFSLVPAEGIDFMGYEKLEDITASGKLDQYTPEEYQASAAVDGDVNTFWLAYGPAVGSGIYEGFTIRLGEEREVKYLLFNLGCWADFSGNETITGLEIEVGNVSQTVNFADEQTQFAVELSRPAPASAISLTVWGISDNEGRTNCSCISEVEVYARVKVEKGS